MNRKNLLNHVRSCCDAKITKDLEVYRQAWQTHKDGDYTPNLGVYVSEHLVLRHADEALAIIDAELACRSKAG